jgi:hypothetical protein
MFSPPVRLFSMENLDNFAKSHLEFMKKLNCMYGSFFGEIKELE